MSDTKNLLKEARKLLNEKEYIIAIKLCKKALKEDKRSYNALVLMAAAMKEVQDSKSQVPTILRKAIDVQPDNPLAWHGLLSYYEKLDDKIEKWNDLVPIYNKLLQLDSEPAKFLQYMQNLAKTLLKLNTDNALSESVSVLRSLQEKESIDEAMKKEINDVLAVILSQHPKLSNDYDEIFEQVLSKIIEDENSKNRHEYYKRYLKLLYKSEKFDKLISEAIKMHEAFNQDIYPLEWLCRVYSELCITHGSCKEIDIVLFYETLLDHDSESILGYFAKAVYLYQNSNLIDSRNILNHLVNIKPKWFHAWLLLGKIDITLYCWEDAEIAALHAQKLLLEGDPHNLSNTINLILLEALIKSSNKLKWKKAEEKFNEIPADSGKSLILKTRLKVLLKDPTAKDLINNLKNDPNTKTEGIILQAINLLQDRHLEEAADVLSSVLETSESWLILGKIHWEMADYGHSLMAFLKSICADPNNWECLVYLGRYHQEYTKDYERSRKCYQKALQLNPNSDQAGIGLSLVHRLLKNTEANLTFLKQLTNNGKGPKWALIQLGLQYLDQGNATDAISTLRNAIKTDPNDSVCWECLADAYLTRGANLSALKSYERALELNPLSFYSMTQLANIQLLVGQHDLAKNAFLDILEQDQNNIAALKGLAESCFHLGKNHAKAQLMARARDDFQEAVNALTRAVKQKSNFLCTWKLFGDILYHATLLPEKNSFLHVTPDFVQSDSEDDSTAVHLQDIFVLTIRCYCTALNISKNSSLLWHDLARCYLTQFYLDTSINRKEVIVKSLAAAKQAVKCNPQSWLHWNLLGVICMTNEVKNYALAQHSFITAVERETNNSVSWTNLGVLYLILEDLYRANEAFSWAQKTDPAFVNCWIGQALIAEHLSHKDAMDLFRHATQMGYHPEATTGYAHWVIKTIMDSEAKKDSLYKYVIEKMHAVTVASDGLHWYTVHAPKDPHALNAYGILLERKKLYNSSADRFSKALEYIDDEKQTDLIKINLARVLVQLGEYEEAVNISASIKNASFASHCQLALSLFKAELFKESYEAYNAALEWLADTESDKAHVLCAMAAMVYMSQESDGVKTLLYQTINIKPPIISGLLALAALGMLDGDKNLTDLVLKELKAHDDNPEYRNHIAKLTAYSYLIHNDMESACRVLCKYVHRYPDSSELWTNLARVLLKMSDTSFNKCVDKALFLGRNLPSGHIAKITCMSSLSKLLTSNYNEGLRSVLNTVHSYPANVDSWSNLITALLPRWSKLSQNNAHWLMILAFRVRNNLTCTKSMEQWLLKNEKQANDIAYC